MQTNEVKVAISKVTKQRHGRTVIRPNAPYKVVYETAMYVKVECRGGEGVHTFLRREEVCLLTIKRS